MAINPDKNAVEQGLIARLIGKIKRIALDMGDSVTVETSRAQAAEASARTEVVQGENCSVTKTTASDGHDVYTINADGKPQVQADWNQADSTKVDYIKNKPNLALKEDVANKKQSIDPTSTTEYGSSKAVADFVNSSVATNTANFLGSFSLADLSLTYPATDVQIAAALNSHTWPSGVTPTNNDYVYVEIQNPQTTGVDDKVERFKFSDMLESWGYEYTLNNSSFTAAEMATLESGVTASDKTAWNSHVSSTSNPHNVTAAQVGAEPAFSVLPVNKGGTGKTTGKAATNNLFSDINNVDTDPDDTARIVFKYGSPSDNNGIFFARAITNLWNYIRGKILGWYDWTRVDSGTGRYAKICSIADPASGTSYTVDVLVTHMTSYYAVTGLVRITVSHGSSSVQASILASDSSFYAVDSGNPPKVYTYVDGNGKRTFVFDTASAYQTAQGFVFRAVGGFSDKWSFFGDVGCSNDAADLGSIGTKQDALDVTFVFATYAKTAGHAETATNYASSGGIADALAGKSSTNHAHDDRYVLFDTNSQGLTGTQKSNARTNIGAGTSNLTLGSGTYDAARGNHAHGLLANDGSFGSQNWAVSNLDRLVIAKNNYNGKEGYLVPSALHFDGDEGGKALTQSAEWKPFLPPTGDGSSVSVTPDGTSTGTDIGKITTLNVWAQKFKNLVSSLKALAFKAKVSDSDISGTISDSHISSADTWNGKQNALGISSLGNADKYINQKGQWTTPTNTWKLNDYSNEGYVKKGEGNYDCVWATNSNGAPDWHEISSLSVGYADSADSAQYAVGASNYTHDGSIAIGFNSISNYAPLGFTHWKLSSPVVSYTPTSSKKYIDGWDRGNDTNKRRTGVAFLYIQNNTSSTIYFDIKVKITPASGTEITYTFTLGCLGSCGVPFTFYMDLKHYKYDFSIYKNPSLSTGSVTCYIGGLVYTGVFESTDT